MIGESEIPDRRFCCPHCGSSKVVSEDEAGVPYYVSAFYGSGNAIYPVPGVASRVARPLSGRYMCDTCMHEWKDEDELVSSGALVDYSSSAPRRESHPKALSCNGVAFADGNMDKAPDAVGDAFEGFTADNTYFIYTDAVNLHGAAGGGIAGMYARRYPNMDAIYVDWCRRLEGDRYAAKYAGPVKPKESNLTQTVICDCAGRENVWDEYRVDLVEDGYEEVPPMRGDLYLETSSSRFSRFMAKSSCLFRGSSRNVYGTDGASVLLPRRRKKYKQVFTKLGNDGVHKAMFIMNTMPALEYGIRDSYEAIVASLEGFAVTRYSYSNSSEQVHKVLVIPAVGCGIGGCSWKVVRPLLEYYAAVILENKDVTQIDGVIIVEPTGDSTDMEKLTIK